MVKNSSAADIVHQFNGCISARDVDGLADLITEDHVMVDPAGTTIAGKEVVLAAWRGFFAAFPDYLNHFESSVSRGDCVIVVGHSTCGDHRLHGPAIWKARVRNGRISEWRIYDDTPQVRADLGIDERL